MKDTIIEFRNEYPDLLSLLSSVCLSRLCSGAEGVRSTERTCLRLGMTGSGVRLSYSSLVIVISLSRGARPSQGRHLRW